MKQFYFLFLLIIFSFYSTKAQEIANINFNEIQSFEGTLWDEVIDNEILLHWDDPRQGEIICYQIIGHNNMMGYEIVLARLPGNVSSYRILEYYPIGCFFSWESSPLYLMAFYGDGEIAISESFSISVDPPRGIHNFSYSYSTENDYIKISWETQGIRPMYYEVFRNGEPFSPISNEFYCYDVEADICSLNTYSFLAFYEDGEELWLENILFVPPYDEEKIPYDFMYEIQDDNLVFFWESLHEEFGFEVDFQIKCNGENAFDINQTYSGMEIPLNEICPTISTKVIDEKLYTGRFCRYSLYVDYFGGEEMIFKAKEQPLYSFIYRLPAYFDYTVNGHTMYLSWWCDSSVGILPSYYQIMENGGIIDQIEGDETNYSISMDGGHCYAYRVFAVYEDETVLIAGYTNEVFVPVLLLPINFTSAIEENNAVLSWNFPIDSSQSLPPFQFKIQRNGQDIATISGDTFTYTDQELEPGTYTYRLFAHYSTGEVLEAENQITLIIDSLTYAEPTNLTYDIDYGGIILFWDIIEGDIEPSSYKIERNGNFIADVPSGVSAYYDTTAGFGTHYYRLFAYYEDSIMKVIPEDSLEVIILEFWEPIITGDNLVFSQYIIFDVEPAFQLSYTSDDNSVNLTWEMLEGSNVVNHYKIERNGNFLFQVDGHTFSFTDHALDFGSYEYVVMAYYTDDSFLTTVKRIVGRVFLTLFSCE